MPSVLIFRRASPVFVGRRGSGVVRVCGGGTVAGAIGDYAEVGTDKDGKPFERRTRFTDVWVLKDGAWQGVNGHASAIPTKP